MTSINTINSQVSFGRRFKKTDESSEAKKRPMLTLNGKGGKRSTEEKYEGVEITEASGPIIFKDKYLDKAIEYAVAGIVFIGAFIGGRKAMRGVTGGFVDATKTMAKKQDGAGILQNAKKYFYTVKENIKATKSTNAKEVKGVLDAIESEKAINASNKIVKGSVIDKLATSVDNDKSIASKIANTKLAKQVIAGSKEGAEKIKKVSSDDVRAMFAKSGLTRGADAVDILGAGVGASAAAIGGRDGADIVTDMNDEQVAKQARKANMVHRLEKYGQAAETLFAHL